MDIDIAAGALAVDPTEWDALAGADNPFVEHAFLRLLESSGSVGEGTGWLPRFVLVREGGTLIGAAPAYLRKDSYGEYVFDWGWAQAATRAGIRYYPKITVAIPFTPATGPRLLVRPGADLAATQAALIEGLLELCKRERCSGIHVLLCQDDEAELFQRLGWIRRATHQYHFHNPGYASYDAFLDALRSPMRKQIKKERRRVLEQGVSLELRPGHALSDAEWQRVNALYLHTSSRKWGRPYLTDAFFEQARAAVGHRAIVGLARAGDEIVAMALSFEKGKHVYGRYWGATAEVDGLHFELCYHQLIEHAITTGKTLVEAGAQGEHKIKRGFLPAVMHSAHMIAHGGLRAAIAQAVAAETEELTQALPEMAKLGPYRRDEG